MLSDHFSVPFEPEDGLHALYKMTIGSTGELTGGGHIETGKWCHLELTWDNHRRTCTLSLDGELVTTLPLLRDNDGACYLRLKSAALQREGGGVLVQHVEVEVNVPPGDLLRLGNTVTL